MIFDGWIRRKLESLLLPWLVEEPEWEVKLGFLCSTVVARKLNFDVVALNRLVEGGGLVLKSVVVEEVSIRIAYWSAPAFTIEVQGVHVTLSAEKRLDQRGDGAVAIPIDDSPEEKKKILAQIDPEGSTLHDNLGKIMLNCTRTRLKDSIINLAMMHCWLHLHNVHLQVEVPVSESEGSFRCLWDTKELNVGCPLKHGRFLGRFISLLFLPMRESSFNIESRRLEVGFEREDHIGHTFICTEPYIGVKLKDFCLIDFELSIPDMEFSFSPNEISTVRVFSNVFFVEHKRCRNGRQLWRMARLKFGTLFPSRKSFYDVAIVAVLWLRLVKAYQNFLMLVGYSLAKSSHNAVISIANNGYFPRSVKQKWDLISKIEEQLPVEAISSARRVARYKAGTKMQCAKDGPDLAVTSLRIPAFLEVTWRIVLKVFEIIKVTFLLKKLSSKVVESEVVSEVSNPRVCFSVTLERISVMLSPVDAVRPSEHPKTNPRSSDSYMDLVSFRLLLKECLFVYEEGFCKQYLSFSMACVEVASLCKSAGSGKGNSLRRTSSSLNEEQTKGIYESRTVIWGDAAPSFNYVEESGANLLSDESEGEIWLIWKKLRTRFQGRREQYTKKPFVLCENRSLWVYPGLKSPDRGFWTCCFTMGKLNVSLGHPSLLSIAVLVGQVYFAAYHCECSGTSTIHSHSPMTANNFTDLKCRSRFESSAKHMKVKLLKLLPDQHVALKAVIAGPRLQFSPRNAEYWRDNQMNLVAGQDGLNLTVDIHDIELAVRPSSRSDSDLSPFYPRLSDADADFFKLEERNLDSTSGLSNEDYACKGQISLCHYLRIDGLNAFFKHSEENRQTQILLLKPLTLESLSSRDYQYSFGTTSVAMSLAFNGVMRGVSAFLYVDELSIIIQEVEELFSMVSRYAFGSCLNSHPYVEHEALQTEPINEEKIMEKTEERDLNLQSTFLMNITFEVGPLHIILHSYRKSNEIRSPPRKFDAYRSKKLGLQEFPDLGVWVSSKTAFLEISAGEGKAKFHAVFSGFQVMTFTYKSHVGKETDLLEVENVVLKSLDCIHEISLSSCTFTMLVDCSDDTSLVGVSGADNVTSGNNLKGLLVNLPSTSDDEMIKLKSIQEKGFFSDISALTQSHWLRVNIGIDVIFMGSCSVKNVLVGLHHPNRTMFSLSIGGDIQKICMGIQGGFIIVEPIAVLMFANCFTSYLPHLRRLFSVHLSRGKPSEPGENLPVSRTRHVKEPAQRNFNADQLVKLEVLELLIVNFSQLSLVLLEADDSGGFKEIVGRIDIYLVLGLENRRRKFLLDLSDLNILSQILNEGQKQAAENIQIPHFASARSSGASPLSVHENTVTTVQDNDVSASSSSRVSAEQYGANDSVSKDIHGNYQNCILERLTAFVTAEKPLSEDVIGHYYSSQGWAGSGCISGLNMTISLPEIQVFTDMVESLSAIFGKDSSDNAEEGLLSLTNPEPENDMEEIPDGAIVAIQDVDQHMWITVECVENKYKLVGAPHHSLAGKKALFRVRYHRQRWNFAKSRFSLISLHAKSDSGEPLRLNYRSRSAFVDISSTNDSAWALWSAISCKRESFKGSENYEGDIGLEFRHRHCKNTFYLLNKKSDCAVAFLDGSLEFVKEPGNPFKFKVFDESSLAHDLAMPDSRLSEADTEKVSDTVEVAPCIKLTVNKVSLTIVTERSEAKDKLPLLRGCINDTDVIVQNLPSKTRVIISMLTVLLHYFDGHRLLWRDLVHPFEICIYFRSKHHSQVAEASKHGASVRLYIRMEELDVMLTELSLDIILYVIGKLDLAGPFAVKNSALLANSCKVENLSGLYLLFHFYDAQSGRVGRRQSAFFFLRPLADQPLEASYVSVKLDTSGTYSTSAIHIPLSESRIFAWRTRVVSSGNGRTYPGPFIVFDISKNSAEGLSIVVSPLIRIHNRTDFLMELHFQRPEQKEDESASVFLEKGDTIDDCMAAFDAVNLSGGSRKAVTSLSVGNFIFSFRPEIREDVRNSKKSYSADWSNTLEGGKAVRLSGIIDKLNYKVRKVLSVESWECSFSIARCSLRSEGSHVANMHFLVQIISRDVPVMQPSGDFLSKNLTLALQKQKEIFLLPTIRVSNLVQSDILVLLTERDTHSNEGLENVGNEATIPCGSSVDLYANPAIIYFTITLVEFGLSCKPVNCEQWVKKLNKKKDGLQYLDIDLDFYGGKCFACLRLVRDDRGILEAVIFTPYKLKNDTDFTLFFRTQKMKSLSRDEIDRYSPSTHPYHGSLLPPKSIQSWYLRSFKLLVKLMDDEAASDTLLDLDALSGFTEISLAKEVSGFRELAKLGVSLGPLTSQMSVPSQIVSIVPRYVVANESDERIFVRQCFLEDDVEGIIGINSGEKIALLLRDGSYKKRDVNVLDKLLQKHRVFNDDSSIFVQFKTNEMGLGWSGPVCVASLGRFFLKFKKSPESVILQSDVSTSYTAWEFAVIHVIEEASTLVLHFRIPPDVCLPYRIENHLCDASITYYQKDTYEPESLGAGCSVDYAWDDLTKPHKLVVRINGFDMSREINLDKLRSWKPFSRVRQQRDLAYHLPFGSRIVDERRINPDQQNVMDMRKVGYEVYADGPTRVLRICEFRGSYKGDNSFHSCKKIQLRVAKFAVHLLEEEKQDSVKDLGSSNHSGYMPIVVGRLERISLDSIFIDQQKYNQITVQSISIDQKWVGAPFAAMLRRHQTSSIVAGNSLLSVFFVLYAGSSSVKQVKYSSIILQPVDLNLDEETLMKIVSFWRTSLSSNTKSQQYYFDHFEIHPVKIIATFLPEDSYSSYSSTQETLRSFLHSVVKIPTIKNMVVELNGVLVTHALVTTRELLIKCAQHYSWYAMRAIYIAKGSSLLPPTFASVFDDLASSSLDVFFDPSSSLLNVQGFTLGTFKLISKCIQKGSFSGTKRYFGDLGKTLRAAGSNILFAAVTEISDSVLKGAERSGFNGMVTGFHQGILKLAMEPSLLGTALMEGGPDRKIKLDRSPGVDELYIEGYLQAMLDMIYKQEYLRVRVIDNQVILKNLPPNSSLIDEIVDRVKDFLVSKALLKGDASTTSSPLRRLRGEHEWRIGPTVLTLCEHLFVSFAIRMLRKQTDNVVGKIKLRRKTDVGGKEERSKKEEKGRRWGIGKFVVSAMVAYLDGRLCRFIPHPLARRIVSGFLLSFLDKND